MMNRGPTRRGLPVRELVLAVMKRGNRPWLTATQVATRIGRAPANTRAYLTDLAKEGVLERREDPIWRGQHEYRVSS